MNNSIWDTCRIAVFDIDGTLYDPKPMRLRMAMMVAWHAATTFDPNLVRLISALRRQREILADAEQEEFEQKLIHDVATASGRSAESVRSILEEWFDTRPLPHLKKYLVPGIGPLFQALRERHVQIGVLSDHRAQEKLAALGLAADFVVSAVDQDIGVQKPNPKGLQVLLDRAGRQPHEAVMIGDRADRDGAIARRTGTSFLLRGKGEEAHFQRFDDPIFHPVLRRS
jgi:HAD superfamily hydrolase (TIGR01549 family)